MGSASNNEMEEIMTRTKELLTEHFPLGNLMVGMGEGKMDRDAIIAYALLLCRSARFIR